MSSSTIDARQLQMLWQLRGCDGDESMPCPLQTLGGMRGIYGQQSWEGTERQGKKVDVTRNECDHMPFLSAPDHVHQWIENVVLLDDKEE